jgi:hypothetical protein
MHGPHFAPAGESFVTRGERLVLVHLGVSWTRSILRDHVFHYLL